jgi:hypothetical protein
MLDPNQVEESVQHLIQFYELTAEDVPALRQIVALYPQPVQMFFDETNALQDMVLADKFTFDMDTDTLILFSRDKNTVIDALIEMAMYLIGFSTMLGAEETWAVELTIGAWKPIKKRVKRAIGLEASDHPRGVVGLPPPPEEESSDDSYPFKTLVSRFDRASFHQMVVLAARDDIAVYFPPDTHPDVMEVYFSTRRAIQTIAKDLTLADHQLFNKRLVDEVQKLQQQFNPDELPFPKWLSDLANDDSRPHSPADELGPFPKNDTPPPSPSSPPPQPPKRHNPFEAFLDELFSDDDG